MWGSVRLGHLRNRLLINYWFIPSATVIVAVGLSFLLPWIDSKTSGATAIVPAWVYGGGPTGARTLLSTIAGSMITVAALVFSITIAGLATASQQYGPRLLRNFINDRGYQLVLGTFLAAFIYCLLVLRTVKATQTEQFVPYLSLAVGLLLAVAGVGVLVYFIHHAAFSIRAETIVASTGRELRAAIDRLFPDAAEQPDPDPNGTRTLPEGFASRVREVPARRSGYIQAIDHNRLVEIAQKHRLVLRLEHRPGAFMVEEGRLVQSWPDRELSEELVQELNNCFVLGARRLLPPDAESAVNQLVEIAIRALSPSVNDPDTAVACIDQLADALGRAGERGIPPALLPSEGDICLVTYPLNYSRLVELALSRIRQYGRGHVPIVLRLLEVIATLLSRVKHESARATLVSQARMLKRASDESIPEPEDRRLVDVRFRAIQKALDGGASE